MAVYLYKIARGDLRYWFNLSNIQSWIVTILMRAIIKVITDFTLIVQFRGQLELGGMYWSMNMIANQIFCFVSVFLYKRFADISSNALNNSTSIATILCNSTDIGNTTNTGCKAGTELPLQEFVIGLFLLSMLCFFGFLFLIKKEYLWTFFDRRTGSQYVIDNWRNGISDKDRFYVFSKHPSLYKSINKELKDWLSENWERWEDENEDWFGAAAISTVPSDLLPKKALSDMGGVTGRKASIVKMKAEKGEVGRKSVSVRRGSDLKIIPMGNV